MRRVLGYLNPMSQLGSSHYSTFFPLLTTLGITLIFEGIYRIVPDQSIVDIYLLFVTIGLIIYFAFRDGIRGGVLASLITILYYLFIGSFHQMPTEQKERSLIAIPILGLLFLFISTTIGWLKQRIDKLITQEADEKQRLQTIIQQLPVGVLITDSKGRLTQHNKQADTILGVKLPPGFRIGKDELTNATLNGKPILSSSSPLTLALSRHKSNFRREFLYKKDGKRDAILQISSRAIKNRDGKVIAGVTTINDITAQKEMEKRKDDFVNMASHELKTPLTSLRLYLDSLMVSITSGNTDKAIKTLRSVHYQAERLQELISDLLDVSRLQTGKLSFTKEDFRLDSLLKQTVEELQGTGKHKLSFTGRSPVKIRADKFRIYQVVVNLITNAMKYSPSDTEIEISLKRKGHQVIVSVKDQGIGIEKSQQKKIFDRLYQVTDVKEKTFPGLGMGLYISREIIKRHKGKIWVDSEKGKGSTFYFSLPEK